MPTDYMMSSTSTDRMRTKYEEEALSDTVATQLKTMGVA